MTRYISLLLANRYFLASLVFLSLLLLIGLTIREVLIVSTLNGLHAAALMDEEETIGVLLVGLGVLLEGRELWTRKAAGKHLGESRYGNLNFDCEFYGFHLLVLGLFIEVIDQAMAFVADYHWIIAVMEYGLYFPLNLLAIGLLGLTLYQILSTKEATAPEAG